MVTISFFFATGFVLLPPDIMKETMPPSRTMASRMPMTTRCLPDLFGGGGNGGRGDMGVKLETEMRKAEMKRLCSMFDVVRSMFDVHFGWVARPIWVMPTRPSTSSTSMMRWYWLARSPRTTTGMSGSGGLERGELAFEIGEGDGQRC